MRTGALRSHRRRPFHVGILGCVAVVALAVAAPAQASLPSTAGSSFGSDRPVIPSKTAPFAAKTPCSSLASITTCVLDILAPAGGTNGVFLQRVGGPTLASANASFRFEPASSIKPLVALYALDQIRRGHARFTDRVPKILSSGGPGDCPPPTIDGQEALGNALRLMLQVSDNNRTRELMQYFGAGRLNAFAASLGLKHTKFQTRASPPGFNPIGCAAYGFNPLPTTLDGNTMSLNDAAKLWSSIASLPPVYANAFYQLGAGRPMANSEGYDYTGVWPKLETIAEQVAPAGPQRNSLIESFVHHMTVSVKGGSYYDYVCVNGPKCEANWFVFAGVAQIPRCAGNTVTHINYTWGYFINNAIGPYSANQNDNPASTAFFNASGQLLAAPIATALETWKACAPAASAVLHLSGVKMKTAATVAIETTLASVTDTDPADITADVLGTIDWGDGYSSSATLSGGSGHFTVHGWHAYAHAGAHKVTIKAESIASGSRGTTVTTITTS